MNFIKLTLVDEQGIIYILASQILTFGTEDECTAVNMKETDTIYVKESPQYIFNLVQGSRN